METGVTDIGDYRCVFFPVFTYYSARPYQGIVPSDASLITSRGRVIFDIEARGLKHIAVADFFPESGEPMRLPDDYTSMPQLKEWTGKHPFESIYIKGFALRDGAGLFWITYAVTASGLVLVDEDNRKISLNKRREQFGTVLWWMYGYFVAPLWLISFINIRKVRNSTEIVNDRKI